MLNKAFELRNLSTQKTLVGFALKELVRSCRKKNFIASSQKGYWCCCQSDRRTQC
ncbi:hypothetical protein [Nostoc spongiaeforme]|uniref:hypothetical protein n=1 Tax=Nostoc spongiaeforme TaxID=502487 RepID=UPI0028BE84C0|nr:hypothetical protein [Nostoc spongiaeforme]